MMLTGSYEVKQLLAGIDSESVTLRYLASVFLYNVKSLFLFRCHAHQYQYYTSIKILYYKEWGSLRSPTPCVCMHFICVSTAWKVIAGPTL